ncbi:uncharacterized protein LOC102233917 isoform X3 [Xiphophorus maculatus]|uniref:uncharacterized protein LOC102233917 isoform X3 n=1 Tax=Xiphophorus maculatus TaxID=8083 RepID=UPI000C6C8C83|nr:uncharacterized protein LOC102233917 isoform X3 [Xiphophorus maculatus]
MAVSVLLLAYPRVILIFLLLHVGDCLLVEPVICDTSCLASQSTDFSAQKGVRYTYRYSAAISTTLHGSGGGRSGLALECVVDIEAVSDCHLTMQIRNSQIKRMSPQREHSVLHLKTLRESLERTRLKFSLQGGKVTALCLQEGEQVWALNIKRALLSMLQTSPMVAKFREETETDVHGTCTSRYERRGPTLLKSRDLRQCQQSRLDRLWPHSVTLTEDTMVGMELHCVQRPGQSMVEEVNCTEVVSLATSLTPLGPVKTKSVSTLLLLKTQPGASTGAESLSPGVFTDLQFEDEGPSRPTSLQEVGRTVALLCSVASDPQLISLNFLELVFQLKDMTLPQLKTLWQESSFKCRNDWQPLLEALPPCGSENCILLLTELVLNNELEEGQVNSFLTTLALIPHPSPQIIGSINGFLARQELRAKAMLAGSSLIYQMCQRFQASCGETPQVEFFMQTIQETLNAGCGEKEPHQIRELIYALKSIGNSGVNAAYFIPLLSHCLLGHQTELELKVAAVKAFRRFPCSADRSVLLQLYRCSREDPEVRMAAYQQLMLCPDQEVFEVVKTTLKNETSSQVGSFVWSHLTNILRSEDPVKQTLIQLLPDDIISRDFEAEFWKYSSYSDHTFVSGFGIKNLETSMIFSPKSFLPRAISANLTMYLHGRAHNLLEVDVDMENFEPLLRSAFDQKTEGEPTAKSEKQETRRRTRRADDGNRREKETCLSNTDGYLSQARAMLFERRRADEERPRCRVSVKIFGNELSVFTCDDVRDQIHQGSLSLAGLAVKLLKGHEVHLSHRGVLMAEELRLPSLSGVPINLGVNMTSLLSLHLKGSVNYRDISHFSLNGYVRPNAYVGLSARMGVDGAPGQAAVEWLAELRSSPSLDGSFQLQEGREVRVTLNTPQDFMDVISLSSRVFQLSGDHREEMKGPKSRIQKTTCTPKSWSKMIGWQLCSNVSYPSLPSGVALPPTGPAHLSLRLLKLDRGLHYYLLEAAYSLHYKRGTWLPREASIHLLLATPQSSIPRDMSLDLAFSSHRVLLRIKHPLKTIVLQGQFDQERNIKSGKLELVIDSVHFYLMGLVDSTSLQYEQRMRYHLEAKMAADQRPVILSANVTRGLGRKSSFSATLKNVFRETASLSVALERRQDLSSSSGQYSVEAELFLPGLVGSRMLGLMEQKGELWSSVLRVKYGLRGDSRNLHQECYTSQRLRRGRDSNLTYIMRADHEFYCTNMEPINHKIHMKHEESPSHIKSVLDLSYGKHWDEINNKHTLLLSQSFRNQSTQNHTSYTLEFTLQVPEKNLNYRTQLMHSRLLQHGSESSTHLKINYNNLMPLVAGLHWKSPPENSLHKKWEGTFNMDTPGQYIYAAYRLSRPNRHALQLTSELTASKWLSIRNLVLDGFYRDRGREKAARLELHTPAATYVQAGVWGAVGRQAVKAHGSLASLWTPPLKANVSLESSKSSHALVMSATCGRQNVSFTAAVSGADKNLKKRQAILKMAFTKPKSPTVEVELEGWVEELRRDRKMYQKAAQLQFRQPFQNFPQTLLLRETFTVDLVKGLYVLETKAGFHDNKEVVHTLTLGYKPPSLFVCSALIHTFSSDTFPSDSEVCVTATSNQTHRDLRGTLQVNGEDKLSLFGQIQQSPSNSNQQTIIIKANFTHELQLQLPSSALMEGYLHWIPKHSTDFDYQARGKLRLERQECTLSVQLNGTAGRVSLRSSLTHPFKSKIPEALEVKAAVDASETGKRSSSLCVRANGKSRVTLTGQMFHRLQNPDRVARLDLDLSQNLLPSVSALQLNMAANVSADSVALHGSVTLGQEELLVQVKGSQINSQVLRVVLLGNVHHSMSVLEALPSVLSLDGVLEHSDTLTEGHLGVNVMEAVHSIELRHQLDAAEGLVKGEGTMGGDYQRTQARLCVQSGLQNLCANVSRHLENRGNGQLSVQLSHSFHRLNTTGVPGDSSAKVKWTQNEFGLSVLIVLQAGAEHVRAEFLRDRTDQRWSYFSRFQHQVKALQARGLPGSFQARAQHQLETGGIDISLVLSVEDERMAEMFFSVGSKNKTSALVMMLWQHMKLLQGHIPNSLQMNCTGVSTEDRLSAHCFGNVANRPVETLIGPQASANISVSHSGCDTNLRAVLHAGGEQKGSVSLSVTCDPHRSLRASVLHFISVVKTLRFPTGAAPPLNVSGGRLPQVDASLELGRCYFRGSVGDSTAPEAAADGPQSLTVNVRSHCPLLQGWVLPQSLALRALLSVAPCQLTVSSSLRVDDEDASLELSWSCVTPYLFGSVSQSFSGLKSRGLPQTISVEASALEGSDQGGAVTVDVGTCRVRARRIAQDRGTGRRLWAWETDCPGLQVHVNGSVWEHPGGVWTAVMETDLKGRRAFLRLDAEPGPELRVEGVLNHDSSLSTLPNSSTLRFSSSGLHAAEVFVQTEECHLRAGGDVMSHPGLQVSLLYHNNCSIIQEWFSPNIMQASGSLLISPASVSSHIFLVVDGKELHTVLSAGQTEVHREAFLHLNHSVPLLKKLGLPVNVSLAVNCESHNNGSRSFTANGRAENQRFSQELKMEKTSETVRVQGELKHAVNYLDKLGVPGSNSVQVELGSAEGRILSLESQCGAQQSGLRLQLKTIPELKEVRGTLWHDSSWLHHRGLPLRISGLCSIKGALSELRSRAELSVDGHKLLTSGLDVSGAAGRLAGLVSFSPAALNQTRTQHKLDTVLTVQFKGPLRSASLDVHRQDWRFLVAGEAGGWGTRAGTKEARFTLKHTERGEASPAFQVEGWGRLTESLLRASMAVDPELSSSFALIVQGHTATPSKELMVNVVHSAPQLLPYLPPQLHLRSQLNQSQSNVAALVEVLSGRRKLWALGELAAMEGGYRQTVEVRHSFPQLQPVPRLVAVSTMYEARRWRHLIQQATVWGSHQFSLSALHSAAPGLNLEPGNRTLKVQVSGLPRLSSLELVHESSSHSRLDSVSLGWKRQGLLEQVHILRSWSLSEETNETKLELKHPFCSALSQLSLHTLSLRSPRKSSSRLQTHLSWDGAIPVNISLTLNKLSSSVGRACVLLSAKRMAVSSGKGCVSMGYRGNLYSQTAEVTWHNKSFRQGMTYQKSAEGLYGLQLYVDLDRVAPAPCHSHMLLAKVQTNLRDRLEHRVELGVCPEQPTLWWSGSHRVNSGEELFYSQCNVSVTGQPLRSRFTLALTNSSTAQGTNISLYTETVVGNWSLLLGSSGLSGPHGAGLQVHATLDLRHQVWVNGTLGGRCLRTAAGYMNGLGLCEDVSAAVCAGMNHSFKAEVQRRERCRETETLGSWSLKTANQRLMMSASGCLERLTAAEERFHFLSSEIQKELLERRKALQHLLTETTEQPADMRLLQDWSAVPLLVSQHAEGLLGQGSTGLLSLWLSSSLRRALTSSLPDLLGRLQQASLQGQQELRRPLATLAGVYQDVKGQRLEAAWREAVGMWTGRLLDVLPAELENPHLRALAAAGASALTAALDVAGQQSSHWAEARLATALSGLRKRLASLYTFSRRDCAVALSVPLLNLNLSRAAEGGLLETVLEEWLLGPLRALASVRPAAELYRFKRRIMDSPFRHQALLVADQFVVTFDGRLYELPVSCPLLLAQDVRTEPSFTLLLGADAQSSLLIRMDNSRVHIQRTGQVKADCKNAVPPGPLSSRGLSVKKGSNKVQVSSQEGQSVSCDLQLELCSFTLDGWLHGASTGLLGTNDNDAGNDFSLRDGSQAKTLEEFFHSWELEPKCNKSTDVSTAAASPAGCASFFSSPDSPLSSCFRVVDPAQFLSVCGRSSSKAPCRLAAAFVHLCQQNYIPVETPGQCMKV